MRRLRRSHSKRFSGLASPGRRNPKEPSRDRVYSLQHRTPANPSDATALRFESRTQLSDARARGQHVDAIVIGDEEDFTSTSSTCRDERPAIVPGHPARHDRRGGSSLPSATLSLEMAPALLVLRAALGSAEHQAVTRNGERNERSRGELETVGRQLKPTGGQPRR